MSGSGVRTGMIVIIIPVEPAIQRVHLLVPAGWTGAGRGAAVPSSPSPVTATAAIPTTPATPWGFVVVGVLSEFALGFWILALLKFAEKREKIHWKGQGKSRRPLKPFPVGFWEWVLCGLKMVEFGAVDGGPGGFRPLVGPKGHRAKKLDIVG